MAAGLLDTNTVILLERLDPGDLPAEPVISAITLAEFSAGPPVTDDDPERAARQARLQEVESVFEPLPFDAAAARSFGAAASALRRFGRKPSARAFDALIAATAIANRLPLYTCNPHDYAGMPGPSRLPLRAALRAGLDCPLLPGDGASLARPPASRGTLPTGLVCRNQTVHRACRPLAGTVDQQIGRGPSWCAGRPSRPSAASGAARSSRTTTDASPSGGPTATSPGWPLLVSSSPSSSAACATARSAATATAPTSAPRSSMSRAGLSGYRGTLRQLVVTGLGRDAATAIITNDRAAAVIGMLGAASAAQPIVVAIASAPRHARRAAPPGRGRARRALGAR